MSPRASTVSPDKSAIELHICPRTLQCRMLPRHAAAHLADLARWYPVVAITGPRQSGKTTLARTTFAGLPYVSLEDHDVRGSALADPRGFLALYPEGAVIDEAQHAPSLFAYLQTRVDDDRLAGLRPGRQGSGRKSSLWVLTGSQHFGLIEAITQSLAGRVGLMHLLPLSLGELQDARDKGAKWALPALLWQGLYPGVVAGGVPPTVWYADYVATYIERDLRQVVNVRDLAPFRTFLRMCAARCSQQLNLSALAVDCGVTTNTARAWLSALEASYIVYLLPQHHVNYGKRLVKAPKLYFYDTGLAAWLAGLRSADELALSSLRGPLFETWALAEAIKVRSNFRLAPSMHYWRDKTGVEVDLLLDAGTSLSAVEFKAGQTVADDWFAPMKRYRALHAERVGDGPQLLPSTLVYGGEELRTRSGFAIQPWRRWPAVVRRLLGTSAPELTAG